MKKEREGSNHYLPRFFQKKFSIDKKPNYVFCYRKNGYVFPPNVRNIGGEHEFYSSELDNDITNEENKFQNILYDLIEEEKVNAEKAALFITHISLRVKNVRTNAEELANGAITGMENIYSDEELFQSFVTNDEVKQAVREKIEKQSYLTDPYMKPRVRKKVNEKNFRKIFSNNSSFIRNMFEDQKKINGPMFAMIRGDLKESAKKGHINALSESLAPDVWLKKFETFNWTVVCFENENLILGDVGALSFDSKTGEVGSIIFCGVNDLNEVTLPLTPNMLLIGTNVSDNNVMGYFNNLKIKEINKFVAKSSNEFFISNVENDELKELSYLIGESASEHAMNMKETILQSD